MEKNRFKQLLESSLGNVKPLIMEQPLNWDTIATDLINNLGGELGNGTTDETKAISILTTNVKTKQDLESLKQRFIKKQKTFDDEVGVVLNQVSEYNMWLSSLK